MALRSVPETIPGSGKRRAIAPTVAAPRRASAARTARLPPGRRTPVRWVIGRRGLAVGHRWVLATTPVEGPLRRTTTAIARIIPTAAARMNRLSGILAARPMETGTTPRRARTRRRAIILRLHRELTPLRAAAIRLRPAPTLHPAAATLRRPALTQRPAAATAAEAAPIAVEAGVAAIAAVEVGVVAAAVAVVAVHAVAAADARTAKDS